MAVPKGADASRGTNPIRRLESYPDDRLRILRGLDEIAVSGVDVLNLSLGPPASVVDPMEPLQMATRELTHQGIVVVAAAGNHGPRPNSLSALARAPWAIGVGATTTEGSLLDCSGRGMPGGPCPTVVCDGTDTVAPPYPPSTSWATPRVSALACWLKGSFHLLAGSQAAAGGDFSDFGEPVKLPVLGFADTKADTTLYERGRSSTQRYFRDANAVEVVTTRTRREHEWLARFSSSLSTLCLDCEPRADPATVKRALELAARPVPGREPSEVGAGFVSDDLIGHFLGTLTPSRWVSLFGPNSLDEAARERVAHLDAELGPVWDDQMVTYSAHLFYGGYRGVSVVVAD